jgi:hypothetical protein
MNNNQTSPIKIRKMVANADRKETAPEIIFVVIGASFGSFLLLWLIYFIYQLDIWIPILEIITGIAFVKTITGIVFVISIQKLFSLFGEKIKYNLLKDFRNPNTKAYENHYK